MNTLNRREPFRPQFHFSAQRHWINDPNGLVWFDGEYHLFFQYNPYGSLWGHMSWGHAVSTDLVNWTELPVAIPEDERAMIFSGSVVVDTHNTSGFGRDGQPVLVACYTACLQQGAPGSPLQAQDLAYSTDRGRTWTKYAGNPVLDIGMKDFRDPKVFWHAHTQRWVMVVVLPDERQAIFYGSPNLREWTELSRFDAPFGGQGIWECPDLMELPAEGGGTVWMLKVDALGGHPSGETGARLFFGHFDGHTFKAEPEDGPRWADHGSDFYAALSWSNLPAEPWQGKAVWLAWMSCHRYAPQTPTDPWRGAMTLPRQLHARKRDGLWRLVQTPVDALQSLRLAPASADDGQAISLNLEPGQAHTLIQSTDTGLCAELQWTLVSVGEGGTAVLRLVAGPTANLAADDEQARVVEVGYDAQRGELYIDRSRSGVIPGGDARYASRRRVACRAPSAGAPLTVRVWWDWSSVEVLADDGEVALTEQCYPQAAYSRLDLSSQGHAGLTSLVRCWPLRAALNATTSP